MPQSTKEKADRFSRMFPPRVEKLIDQFRVIGNCSNPSNYHFDREAVTKVWVHILRAVANSAKEYGLNVQFTIQGKTLDDLYKEGSIQSLLKDPEALF